MSRAIKYKTVSVFSFTQIITLGATSQCECTQALIIILQKDCKASRHSFLLIRVQNVSTGSRDQESSGISIRRSGHHLCQKTEGGSESPVQQQRATSVSPADVLHRWHLIATSCWSSSERPILSQMFVEAVSMSRCLI